MKKLEKGNDTMKQQQTQHRAPKKKKKHSWKWRARYAWSKASPYVKRFCWIISKAIVWIVLCGLVIVLTRVTGWQEIANVLTENLTPVGILRDILLVMLGVAVGRSYPKKKKKTTKNTNKKEASSSVQKVQSTAGEAQSAGQASKQE